jgi:TATA-box binding protein (TBP) (component of TFIID and TFIIIB)
MTQNKSQYRSKLRAKIQNVITTADLKQKADAARFINYPWGRYNIQYYGGRCGYVKDETIQGRVTVFLSGKLISTDAKSLLKSIDQLQRTHDLLCKVRESVKVIVNGSVRDSYCE